MKSYDESKKAAKKEISGMTTAKIKKEMKEYGSDGKRWARAELKKRGIFKKKSPEEQFFESIGFYPPNF